MFLDRGERESMRQSSCQSIELLSLRSIRISFVLICVLFGISCRKEAEKVAGPPLFPVGGSIRIDRAIPVGATIRFHSAEAHSWGRMPMAIVEADGTFRGSFAKEGDGVPAGEYELLVYWMTVPEGGGLPVDRLQGKFADPKKPVAKIVIHEGANEIPLIELSSKSH